VADRAADDGPIESTARETTSITGIEEGPARIPHRRSLGGCWFEHDRAPWLEPISNLVFDDSVRWQRHGSSRE
jgi:hypothetical protein